MLNIENKKKLNNFWSKLFLKKYLKESRKNVAFFPKKKPFKDEKKNLLLFKLRNLR